MTEYAQQHVKSTNVFKNDENNAKETVRNEEV